MRSKSFFLALLACLFGLTLFSSSASAGLFGKRNARTSVTYETTITSAPVVVPQTVVVETETRVRSREKTSASADCEGGNCSIQARAQAPAVIYNLQPAPYIYAAPPLLSGTASFYSSYQSYRSSSGASCSGPNCR